MAAPPVELSQVMYGANSSPFCLTIATIDSKQPLADLLPKHCWQLSSTLDEHVDCHQLCQRNWRHHPNQPALRVYCPDNACTQPAVPGAAIPT